MPRSQCCIYSFSCVSKKTALLAGRVEVSQATHLPMDALARSLRGGEGGGVICSVNEKESSVYL